MLRFICGNDEKAFDGKGSELILNGAHSNGHDRRSHDRRTQDRDRKVITGTRFSFYGKNTICSIRSRFARGEVRPATKMQRSRGPLRKHETRARNHARG